jgi:hypothetical protein
MGYFVRTTATVPFSTSKLQDLDNPGEQIFPVTTRELGPIAGTTPKILHHGLVVEKSGNFRYREFVTFHGDYVYPEYLLAYRRVDSSHPKEQVDLVIGGATGKNASKVNGIYESTNQVYNGKLLFQKRGMPDLWLCFKASNRVWMVHSTADNDANIDIALCHCNDKDLDDPKRALSWKVWEQSSGWEDQANVKCVELLSSLVIGGATGANSSSVNGIYEPTSEVYNGKLLFKKRDMSDIWLRFEESTRFWVVSSTTDKDAKNDVGFCHSSDKDLDDPKLALVWKVFNGSSQRKRATSTFLNSLWNVWNGSSFESEGDVKCVELLSSVVIRGAAGKNASKVNGIYEPTSEVYNGKLLFKKRDMKDLWLRFEASTSSWMVSSTADKDENNSVGWCHCNDEHLNDPKRALVWKVRKGSSFEEQVEVKCVQL